MTRQYAEAGVDLEGAETAKARIARAVATTRTPLSVGRIGAFGGMVRIPEGMRRPTLVLSTDGVGTKVLVALEAGRFDSVGEDLVNHSVNDILVHGATPIANATSATKLNPPVYQYGPRAWYRPARSSFVRRTR